LSPANLHGRVYEPLTILWLSGAGVMFGLWLRRLFAALDWWASGSPISDSLAAVRDLEAASLVRMQQRIGLQKHVELRLSPSRMEPALLGLWAPEITIPEGLSEQLSAAELDAVMLHELAHAKRWDNLSSAFAHAVVCVFWFHPLLWWIERRLIFERELACDEMVIHFGVPPESYVAGILKVCPFHLSEAVAGVSGVGSNLKNRLEVIMSLSVRKPIPYAPKVLLGALIAVMTMVPLALSFLSPAKLYGQAKEEDKQPSQANQGGAITCLSADVAYPEGTVIQEWDGPEQMCAHVYVPINRADMEAGVRAEPMWIHTNEPMRERSQTVIHIPKPPPFVCAPQTSIRAPYCECETNLDFSQGARVDSAHGKLRCDKGNWLPVAADQLKAK
jgi:beta-lactamase regulating signal transducer with metallopeptidase domain